MYVASYTHDMPTVEHTFTNLLRHSGAVVAEAERQDVVLHRRDGEDLFLGLRSRERGVRETVGVLAHLLRFALHDPSIRMALTKGLSEGLAWTHFLPDHERERFLDDISTVAAACYDMDAYEPLVRELGDWRATAETYALFGVSEVLAEVHAGPAVDLPRPNRRV